MKAMNVLVVEDEELARERLARLIRERGDLVLVGACRNCDEAERLVGQQPVDLALLDIQMPGTNGMRFSQRLRELGDSAPIVVFVTAHRRYACDAFDLQAADYLLKPFDRERLQRALEVARERVEARAAQRAPAHPLLPANSDMVPSEQKSGAPGRVLVRDSGRILIVRSEQIDWIEADGRECVLHCGNKMHRIGGPFADLVARLDNGRFVQVSRSSLVNIDSIAQLQEMFKGDLVAVMKGGQEVHVSRRFRSGVMDRLAS
ncbi:MAG: LytTR family DNA-binding domain-containing protein [Rudaea sp.]